MKQSCCCMFDLITLFYISLPIWPNMYYDISRKILCVCSRSLSPNVWSPILDFIYWRTLWYCDFTEYTLDMYRNLTGKGRDCKTDWGTGTAHCLFMAFWHFVALSLNIANDSYFCISHTRIINHKPYFLTDEGTACMCKQICVI
jgi:hypothetical protein